MRRYLARAEKHRRTKAKRLKTPLDYFAWFVIWTIIGWAVTLYLKTRA